jgi:hypothetical protein
MNMQTEFGSGVLWAVPMIDLAGNNVAVPTPVPFGAMQDVSVDFSFSVKELYGMYQFPIDVARGTAKVGGKSKVARFNAGLFNQILGENMTANEMKVAFQESANVGANNFTVAAAANFSLDLGVTYSNGTPLARNSAAGAAGQYVVDAANGKYTFHANDANTTVLVSYAYTANNANATGRIFTINNQLLGLSCFFKLVLNQNRRAKHMTLILNRCISTKLSVATKLEDFTIPEMDFSAMADDSGVVGQWSMAEP